MKKMQFIKIHAIHELQLCKNKDFLYHNYDIDADDFDL